MCRALRIKANNLQPLFLRGLVCPSSERGPRSPKQGTLNATPKQVQFSKQSYGSSGRVLQWPIRSTFPDHSHAIQYLHATIYSKDAIHQGAEVGRIIGVPRGTCRVPSAKLEREEQAKDVRRRSLDSTCLTTRQRRRGLVFRASSYWI